MSAPQLPAFQQPSILDLAGVAARNADSARSFQLSSNGDGDALLESRKQHANSGLQATEPAVSGLQGCWHAGNGIPGSALHELTELVAEIRDEWLRAAEAFPTKYRGPEDYLTRLRGLVRAGRTEEALAEVRTDYSRLVYPTELPTEAEVRT